MSVGPAVATATVRIVPDTTGFKAELERQIAKATTGVTASVRAEVSSTAAAASAAATSGVTRTTGAAGANAARGIKVATNESNALRGALIGLSRVTPVTVFGLGVYGTAAIAAGYAIKGAIKSTADFEHQLNIFQATTSATADEMARVGEEAKKLGSDLTLPATSAGDAALAMTELAKGGLSVQDTLAAARGTLQLAAAAQLDVGTAAEFVVTELNAFGLAGTQAIHIADLLAGASIAAQGDIRDFGTAFQQVSAVSRQTGVNVEATTGALTELAKAGLRGADAGTSLRTFLLRLTPTTKQAQQYMDALGISYDKTKTVGSQLGSILDQLQASTSALNEAQKTQALTQIFGQDAIRSASILVREGSRGLDENTRAANRAGSANRLAAANAKGLSGAVNGLKNNADTLGITLGNYVKGPLTTFVETTAAAIGLVNDLAVSIGDLSSAFFNLKTPDFLGGSTTDHIAHSIESGLKKGFLFAITGKTDPLGKGKDLSGLFDDTGLNRSGGGVRNEPRGAGEGLPSSAINLTPAEKAAVRARIAALTADRKKRKLLPGDTQATNKLQIAQLNAQLHDDLQAELTADKAIESYFHERLKLAKQGTARYTAILGAEQQAHSAAAGVQAQIDSEAQAARASAKAKRDQEIADAKQAADAAKAQAKTIFNLEKSKLDLGIAVAGLTKPIADDVRANRAEIRFYNAQIARIEAIRKRRKLTLEEQQAVVDYRTAIIGLRATIASLKNQKDSNGFSLSDLFQESVNQFNEFASNVATSVTTPGGARGALAGAILSQRASATGRLEGINSAQLAAATRTNSLLQTIIDNQNGALSANGKVAATATSPGLAVGAFTARRAAVLAGVTRGD